MRIFTVAHAGVVLTGYSVVVAETRERALELINAALFERGLRNDVTLGLLEEIDLSVEGATVLHDGDY